MSVSLLQLLRTIIAPRRLLLTGAANVVRPAVPPGVARISGTSLIMLLCGGVGVTIIAVVAGDIKALLGGASVALGAPLSLWALRHNFARLAMASAVSLLLAVICVEVSVGDGIHDIGISCFAVVILVSFLLAEDEHAVGRGTELLLQELACSVTWCRDGREALDVFERDADAFDVLILDHSMPRMLGSEVAERVALLRPHLPIIAMSGFADSFVDSPQCAHRIFLPKPFHVDQMTAALTRVLASARGTDQG